MAGGKRGLEKCLRLKDSCYSLGLAEVEKECGEASVCIPDHAEWIHKILTEKLTLESKFMAAEWSSGRNCLNWYAF